MYHLLGRLCPYLEVLDLAVKACWAKHSSFFAGRIGAKEKMFYDIDAHYKCYENFILSLMPEQNKLECFFRANI